MRTALILTSGFLLLTGLVIFARLYAEYYPNASSWATYGFIALWLLATGFNMWVGVNRAGYSVREELPIMLLLFAVPTAVALVLRWKVL